MRRRIFLLIMMAVLCVTAGAFAVELTWNQSCTQKTSQATTLYVQIDGQESLTAANMLPAGTYIRTTGRSMEGKTGISYSANNLDPLYGYIDGSVIVSATQSITLPSGTTVTVSEALVRSRQALNLWLEMEYGESLEGSSTYTDENGIEHEIGDEAAAGTEQTSPIITPCTRRLPKMAVPRRPSTWTMTGMRQRWKSSIWAWRAPWLC